MATALPAATDFTGAAVTEGQFKTAITSLRAFLAEMLDTTGGGASTVPLALTVSSASTALRITQTGAGNVLVLEDSANPDSTPIVVDGAGIMVTGHTAAVDTGSSNIRSQIHGTSTSLAARHVTNWGSNTGGAVSLFSKARGDTIGTPTALTSGDDIGVQRYFGYAGATGSWVEASRVEIVNTGTVSDATNGVGAFWRLFTRASGGSLTERLRVDAGGNIYQNDSTNANMTLGLTLNQGSADDEILALKSSDVAHGVTNTTETDTFGFLKKASATGGGLQIGGMSENATVTALQFLGVGDTTVTKSTAGTGIFSFDAYENDGSATAAALTTNSNMAVFRSNTTTRFILDADGDSHQDVGTAWTNFDAFDDVQLLTDLSVQVSRDDDPIRREFGALLHYNREALTRAKLVTFNDDGHHFVNMSKLTMAHTGAIRQVGAQVKALLADMLRVTERLTAIEHARV